MAEVVASSERHIAAPADRVYAFLADYREQHPKILPPAFSGFHVEEGGVGEGTVVRFKLNAGGRTREYRMRVAEPERGRVLAESDTATSLVTTFTVDGDGGGSRVSIQTCWQGAGGIGGFFERTFAPRVLRKLYAEELDRLEECTRD